MIEFDGAYINDGIDTNKISIGGEADNNFDVLEIDEELGLPLNIDIGLYDPPVIFDFRERDYTEVISYDAQEIVDSALIFLRPKLGFLSGLGRVITMNHVKTDPIETKRDEKQGSIITGSLTFNIRLANSQLNRILNIDVELPIEDGKFVTPSVFKCDNKEHVLSPDGIRKAFRASNVVRIVFPEKRKSHRWPRILDRDADY